MRAAAPPSTSVPNATDATDDEAQEKAPQPVMPKASGKGQKKAAKKAKAKAPAPEPVVPALKKRSKRKAAKRRSS